MELPPPPPPRIQRREQLPSRVGDDSRLDSGALVIHSCLQTDLACARCRTYISLWIGRASRRLWLLWLLWQLQLLTVSWLQQEDAQTWGKVGAAEQQENIPATTCDAGISLKTSWGQQSASTSGTHSQL